MHKEKLDQLRKVFKTIIEEVVKDVEDGYCAGSFKEEYIKKYYNRLVYEVKIRINNK